MRDTDAVTDGGVSSGQDEPTRVAIACQGGGSHTAFTAGVLRELLAEWDHDRHELVGISGTSGGAFNALAVWYGLVTGDEENAIDLLESLWADLAATAPPDQFANSWLTNYSRFREAGGPVPKLSPYHHPVGELGSERIESILERHIEFEEIPPHCTRTSPELVVGTVNVNAGVFETFTNEDVTVEAVLASSAVPDLFRGVEINGHLHWDGLFSQNPPVDDLLTVDSDRKPEELWIIQINPQERADDPTSLGEIADRRNELSGNISLNQELRFVRRVNEWVEEGHLPEATFAKPEIHRIEMGRDYHYSTKLDRSPEFIEELLSLGSERAAAFRSEHDAD